ncbi:MAG TPA: sodium-dependent bicarbonate transport family permease [Steroidobacteraceae bacterium]|nr:sodium-dependent bicarbonate transport family permease [Steroidobacteraceae bacterium]HRX89465.1 sodium-dependent bicarbonate transport family permease [Steroidobacteraceae bacterium]
MSIDPVVLFFVLGVTAGLLKSELRLPPAIYDFVSTLLLLSIGLKGGIELARQPVASLALDMLSVIALGAGLALLAFAVLHYLARINRTDAAAIAGHYGSVSVATFAVGIAWLQSQNIPYEAEMPLFLVMLEIPGIVVGILLARGVSAGVRWGHVLREVMLGRSIVLLMGGLLIGWVAGPEGLQPLAPLYFDLFKGILGLFLLEMGLIAAAQLAGFRAQGIKLVTFALLIPPLFGLIGAFTGTLMGLSLGGTVLLAVLAASASYIAAPASMRTAVPAANPALSLTMSLAFTFPFNILVGIPLYQRLAEWLQR